MFTFKAKESTYNSQIAQRIGYLKGDLSNREFARKCQIPESNLRGYLKGKGFTCIEGLIKIATYTNTSLDDLVGLSIDTFEKGSANESPAIAVINEHNVKLAIKYMLAKFREEKWSFQGKYLDRKGQIQFDGAPIGSVSEFRFNRDLAKATFHYLKAFLDCFDGIIIKSWPELKLLKIPTELSTDNHQRYISDLKDRGSETAQWTFDVYVVAKAQNSLAHILKLEQKTELDYLQEAIRYAPHRELLNNCIKVLTSQKVSPDNVIFQIQQVEFIAAALYVNDLRIFTTCNIKYLSVEELLRETPGNELEKWAFSVLQSQRLMCAPHIMRAHLSKGDIKETQLVILGKMGIL